MSRLCIVCEGQTEETFVRDVLAPALGSVGLNVTPQTIETSPGHRGGALNYDRVRMHLRNTLRQKSAPFVTTFFDLYRLDKRFPCFEQAQLHHGFAQKLEVLLPAFHADIINLAGCTPGRFIAHIQPHEFEALLFSDVPTLIGMESAWSQASKALSEVRASALSPEHINHHPHTKPAAHLERLLTNPRFNKVNHGPIAAARMGLSMMESQCVHFAAWMSQLRALTKP